MLEFDADAMLSIALRHDERKAFDIIFTRYYSRVKQFVRGFCGDEYEAENITQDIFMKLWVQRDRIPAIETLDAYVYMMAKNAALNALKRMVRERRGMAESMEVADKANMEEALYSKELMEIVHRHIGQMPPQRRRVFTMSRIDGLKNEEIAERLNISKRTVETHISAALSELRRLMLLAVVEILVHHLLN
uniref:RNA polymerase sigma-70 factor n=1 Tax=Prevotella sp. GTC17262 TaxID=3236797 RepID=A0AB33JIW3_9BACT